MVLENQGGTPIAETMVKIARLLKQWQKLILLLLLCLITSGCVNYDVGIKFDSPNRGAIVQQIQLDDRLSTFTSGAAQSALNNIEQRVRRLNGKTRRLSNQAIEITIPFSGSRDLATKFNRFFSDAGTKSTASDLPNIDSKFTVRQGNFLFFERTRLIYDVDLRSLGIAAPDGSVLIDPKSILNLQFRLETPWGARSLKTEAAIPDRRDPKQLVWTLQPGQQNHLEAAFWMPNPLGIGTVIVIGIVSVGIYLKERSPSVAKIS